MSIASSHSYRRVAAVPWPTRSRPLASAAGEAHPVSRESGLPAGRWMTRLKTGLPCGRARTNSVARLERKIAPWIRPDRYCSLGLTSIFQLIAGGIL